MYGVTNGKIAKRRNKTGFSYNFLLVKNRRNPMNGKAGYDVIWNFGTIRDNEIKDRANAFWAKADLVLETLANQGKIYRNDADKIRRQFAEYIPLPIAAPMPIGKKINPSTVERVRGKFGDKIGDLLK